MKDTRTLAQLAQEALDVQDASNLSGVVHGWSRSISRLRELLPDVGTEKINTHPINVLWADKVAHLTLTQDFMGNIWKRVEVAWDECKQLAADKVPPAAEPPPAGAPGDGAFVVGSNS